MSFFKSWIYARVGRRRWANELKEASIIAWTRVWQLCCAKQTYRAFVPNKTLQPLSQLHKPIDLFGIYWNIKCCKIKFQWKRRLKGCIVLKTLSLLSLGFVISSIFLFPTLPTVGINFLVIPSSKGFGMRIRIKSRI